MKTIIVALLFTTFPLQMNDKPLVITEEEKVIEKITHKEYALSDEKDVFIDDVKWRQLANQLNEVVFEKPIDAKIDLNGNIDQEKAGKQLDRTAFLQMFSDYFYTGKPTNIEIPVEVIFPRVDSELLSEIYDQSIGEYVTHFKKSNKERSHNIELATKAIDNQVVFPGEQFSFNKVVGKRTKERGYMKAPVIVKGEYSEDIGGGICQVSSTLYNAVRLKGIDIVERYTHSRSVPYVPPGKDATVSWWGPDFVFENRYDQPILIQASVNNGKMAIQIYTSSTSKLMK